MQRSLIGAVAAAALTLTGLSAHASCADPRIPGTKSEALALPQHVLQDLMGSDRFDAADAGDRVVGTWRVTYDVEGAYFADALIQWHRDGTEWENINRPILGGTICMGEWKRVDEWHVSRSHIGWLFTNGIVSGYFTETETDKVSADGKSYTGTNDQKIFDLSGNMQVEVTGTSSATRIAQ